MGTLKVNGNIETNKILGSDVANGLIIESKSSAGQGWGEGVYIVPHSNGFATLTLGPTDRTSACAIVYHYDTKTHYLEVKSANTGIHQSYIPYATGTLLNSGNYTDYTVTKTGSGASGTWGINISGNASTASKWSTGRTFTIGGAAKSVDGSSDVSWSASEIGVPYVYHTGPGFSAYGNWGMMISRTRNTYGESGKGDNYYIATDASNNLRTGHQLNGTADITWTDILNERNYTNYCEPKGHSHNLLTGGGEGSSATKRYNHYTCAVLSGGWGTNDAGYGYQYGTTLDISGYSTWYHRLAFWTNGTIEYWQGINTDTMTKIGRLITSANIGEQSVNYASYASQLFEPTAGWLNWSGDHCLSSGDRPTAKLHFGYSDLYLLNDAYHILLHDGNYTSYCAPASHSHNYVVPGAPNNLMHSGNEFTFAPAGYNGGVWFNYRTASWNTDGNISQYIFGNGKGGVAPIEHLYDITHNYGAYDPNYQSPPGTGVQGAIFYQI